MTLNIHRETPAELFQELVEEAIAHQKVDSSVDSTTYLVQLLSSFVRPERIFAEAGAEPDQPLAEIFCTAISSDGMRKIALLKLTGDVALFVTGFASDSLSRSLVDASYYGRLGGLADGKEASLSQSPPVGSLFAELASHFSRFVDVLNEVSENCALTDSSNILRLYENWLSTGSERAAELLRRQDILVVPGSTEVH